MKILILCTGNSCRSQMAEGFLKSFDPEIHVYSAGTKAVGKVHPLAIRVMEEAGIDISANEPESVDKYTNKHFDFVITVCSGAEASCPSFSGNVKTRLHIGFDDPAEARGSNDEVLDVFREIRDQINHKFYEFYKNNIKP